MCGRSRPVSMNLWNGSDQDRLSDLSGPDRTGSGTEIVYMCQTYVATMPRHLNVQIELVWHFLECPILTVRRLILQIATTLHCYDQGRDDDSGSPDAGLKRTFMLLQMAIFSKAFFRRGVAKSEVTLKWQPRRFLRRRLFGTSH